eukprot:TRINITY_DN2543_c0_g1_i1.p1 TRINITY_DN2543_c0_g1~~TRINITY_DN2543_c0_g1_i1.p1  ORF type:complete len:228 (+),score=68.30 TRINITY_DN2543_c0_g1_i1:84-767(+)
MAVVQQDELDRVVAFYNDKDKFDKFGKAIQFGIRSLINVVHPQMSKDLDLFWRYILDARKMTWLGKWVQEYHTMRVASKAQGDQVLVKLRVMQRFFLMVRWGLENLHVLTKIQPAQRWDIIGWKDCMVPNRYAKATWLSAIICAILADFRAVQVQKGQETEEQKKMRRLRLIQCLGDSQVCLHVLQIPQKLSRTLIGREKAFLESYVGLCGCIAACLQCYFLYPAQK